MEKKPFLECGKIISSHGIDGTLRVEPWTDDCATLLRLKTVYLQTEDGMKSFSVRRKRQQNAFALLTLEGIEDRNASDALRGETVFAAREDIPLKKGSHFIADLIGLPVFNELTGEQIGTLSDVVNRGATDLYDIKGENKTYLVPVIPQFVSRVDENEGIFIVPIDGLLDI